MPIGEHVGHGWAREQAPPGARELLADTVVIRIEENLVVRVERLVAGFPPRQNERLKKPSRVCQMPSRRARVRHRLDDVVLDRQRLAQSLTQLACLRVSLR